MSKDKLTPKQEAYAQHLAAGKSQREAYKQAGYSVGNMTPDQIDREACVLAKHPKVSQRLKEIQAALSKEILWDRKKSFERLLRFADIADKRAKKGLATDSSWASAGIKAIDSINKMLGLNEPDKLNIGQVSAIKVSFGCTPQDPQKEQPIVGEYTNKINVEEEE